MINCKSVCFSFVQSLIQNLLTFCESHYPQRIKLIFCVNIGSLSKEEKLWLKNFSFIVRGLTEIKDLTKYVDPTKLANELGGLSKRKSFVTGLGYLK